MRKCFYVFIIYIFSFTPLWSAEDPYQAIGFWKTMDSKEAFTTSVIAVYQYDGALYGRVIVGYNEKNGKLEETWENPVKRIEKLSSKPLLLEVDLFWGHTLEENTWKGGRIVDPRTGYSFSSDIWIENEMLVLRGKFGPFGVRQLFYKADITDMPPYLDFPDLNTFRPLPIPK
ncbi:MAG: DUF2147 domain-containing protein [Sphaerochaetaceae bacterium]